MTDYEVIKEIEVLREFAANLCADLRRYMEENSEDKMANAMLEEVENVYTGVYDIDTLKEAYIARGKLQIVNIALKKLTSNEESK